MARHAFLVALIGSCLCRLVGAIDESKVAVRAQEGGGGGPPVKLDDLKSKCSSLDNAEIVPCLMNAFVLYYDIKPEGFCLIKCTNCPESIKNYVDRCRQDGEKCLQLDNVKLVSLGTDKDEPIYVPDLVQAQVANFIFNESGAKKKCEIPTCFCRGECNCDCDCKYAEFEYVRDSEAFNRRLAAHNLDLMDVGEDGNVNLLRRFLYYAVLYYLEFYLYPGTSTNWASNRNLQPTLRYSRSYRTRRKFGRRRRHEKMRIYLKYEHLNKVFNSLQLYLEDKTDRPNRGMPISFAKVVRYTILKSVPYYKHSYLFADYLKKNKIDFNKYCDPYSPNGTELVTDYLKRCEEGECYIFDDYYLFNLEGISGGDNSVKFNYKLPNLSEVNLVYSLLGKVSYKYGKTTTFFCNKSRAQAEIQYMAPRLLTINQTKFDEMPGIDDAHMIVQKFLYYCAIYFVRTYREGWIPRQTRHIASWDVKSKLAKFLDENLGGSSIAIDKSEIEAIFPAFKSYLNNSYYRNHPNWCSRYVAIMEAVLTDRCSGSDGQG